jgi:hypothetical protein
MGLSCIGGGAFRISHAHIPCYHPRRRKSGAASMKNPLDSLWGTVIAGLLLTVVLYVLARSAMGG